MDIFFLQLKISKTIWKQIPWKEELNCQLNDCLFEYNILVGLKQNTIKTNIRH